MILSDTEILHALDEGSIVIDPFDRANLGSHSYDVHLGPTIATYKDRLLDARKHNEIALVEIPPGGMVLDPGVLYLGVTREYTESHKHVPFLEGRSSVGRLGIDIHATAGKGDVGFCNHWTLEISVKQPVRIYTGMPIGQILYFSIRGKIACPYHRKPNAHYTERSDLPVESMLWKSMEEERGADS